MKYEERIVALIKIVGLETFVSDEDKYEECSAILKLPYIFEDAETAKQLKIKGLVMSSLSNCMVLSMPLKERDAMDKIVKVISALSRTLLSEFGLLLRGGISVGNVYHDSLIVFGPALHRAEQLESESAIYPRIIMNHKEFEHALSTSSQTVRQMLRGIMSESEDGYAELRSYRYWDVAVIDSCLDMLNRSAQIHTRQNLEWMKHRLNSAIKYVKQSE